ncbi:MAG: hypothetical protein HY619_03210 [Thaumarchaeota archaeon]|nr:hypothetical protein [Nitrososphaerota archaeon]
MGRKATIFGIWVIGYSLGFLGYLAAPMMGTWLLSILPSLALESMVGALISGIVSSVIVTFLVMLWARFSE